MIPKIVITGAGVVSALGCGKEANLAALRQCRCGISAVRYLDTKLRDCPVGEVPVSDGEISRLLSIDKTLPRTALIGILALKEALEEAGLPLGDSSPLPLVSGTTVGGMDLTEKSYPIFSKYHDCGATTDAMADFFGCFSYATTISTACSSAANAIGFGANLIRAGRAVRVVAGGAESLSSYHLNGFNSLMILDRGNCKPFDLNRAGLNLGEGAGFVVLESEEAALRRGARPLAYLDGFGNACDAFHQTASSENGEGAFRAMMQALACAGLSPSDIDYVNAHGTGTPNNDASESAALKRVFGDKVPPVSSTKALTGHTTSASGSIEAIFSILALQQGFIPAQYAFETADPACITPTAGGDTPLRHVLCNAFGFGGNDSSLILSHA